MKTELSDITLEKLIENIVDGSVTLENILNNEKACLMYGVHYEEINRAFVAYYDLFALKFKEVWNKTKDRVAFHFATIPKLDFNTIEKGLRKFTNDCSFYYGKKITKQCDTVIFMDPFFNYKIFINFLRHITDIKTDGNLLHGNFICNKVVIIHTSSSVNFFEDIEPPYKSYPIEVVFNIIEHSLEKNELEF